MSEGDMTICSPSTGYIALRLHPQAILPASGEQIKATIVYYSIVVTREGN